MKLRVLFLGVNYGARYLIYCEHISSDQDTSYLDLSLDTRDMRETGRVWCETQLLQSHNVGHGTSVWSYVTKRLGT